MIILSGCVAQLVRAQTYNDRMVAGSMPILGINANYLTSTLCGAED